MRTGIKKVQIIKLSDLKDSNDPGMQQGVEVVYSDGEFDFRAGKAFEEVDCNVHFSNLTITDQSSNVSMFSYLANMRIDTRGKYLDYIKRYGNHALIVLLTSIEDTVYQLGTSYNPVYLRTNIQTDYLKGEHAGTTMEVEWIFPVVHVLRDVHNEEGYCIVLNTLNESVGTEVNGDIIVDNSRLEIKNTEGAILYTKEVVAERDDETIIGDSKHTVKNQDGEKLIEANLLATENKTSEIWAKDYRPLIFEVTTDSNQKEVHFGGTGNRIKRIVVKDNNQNVLKDYIEDASSFYVEIQTLGIYYIEIYSPEYDYFNFNSSTTKGLFTGLIQFGDVVWDYSLGNLFRTFTNMIIYAEDEMKIAEGFIGNLNNSFQQIKEIKNTNWLSKFPFNRVQGRLDLFFQGVKKFPKRIILDFKGTQGVNNVNRFFDTYASSDNGLEELIIYNMEDLSNANGVLIGSFNWETEGLRKVIFQGLQVSQDMSVWRPTDPVNIMLFFLNLGDRTGETQSTITLRNQEWNLLSDEQKDVIEDILINRNWAIALN